MSGVQDPPLHLLIDDKEGRHHTGHSNQPWDKPLHEVARTLLNNNVLYNTRAATIRITCVYM